MLVCLAGGSVSRDAERPNVIFIVADDLGYGELGCYGGTDVPTPHLDSLARQGVRFTNAYVTAPFCAASRAALLTGRYQTRFGYEFNPVGRDRTGGVSLDETFIGQAMQKAGYHTGMIGKWHLGQSGGYHPAARGFDEFFGTTAGANAYIVDTRPGDEFHTPRGAEGIRWISRERPSGSFLRQLTLGQGLDTSAISANYENGVLSVVIPISEKAKPRKVAVQTVGQREQLTASAE